VTCDEEIMLALGVAVLSCREARGFLGVCLRDLRLLFHFWDFFGFLFDGVWGMGCRQAKVKVNRRGERSLQLGVLRLDSVLLVLHFILVVGRFW